MKKFLNTKFGFLAFGLLNVVVFHYAIYRLFIFLYDSSNRWSIEHTWMGVLINLALIMIFTIPHSWLLSSNAKKFFYQYIPTNLYPSLYSLHACISIILMDLYWVDLGIDIYNLQGANLRIMQGLYAASWLMMFWSMLSTGLFKQSGIQAWWRSINKKPQRNDLPVIGAYQICRHPIYASFIGMIWTTPHMTAGHLMISLIWGAYILYGAYQKDKRLIRNKFYQEYMQKIVAFPFIPKRLDNLLVRLL